MSQIMHYMECFLYLLVCLIPFCSLKNKNKNHNIIYYFFFTKRYYQYSQTAYLQGT